MFRTAPLAAPPSVTTAPTRRENGAASAGSARARHGGVLQRGAKEVAGGGRAVRLRRHSRATRRASDGRADLVRARERHRTNSLVRIERASETRRRGWRAGDGPPPRRVRRDGGGGGGVASGERRRRRRRPGDPRDHPGRVCASPQPLRGVRPRVNPRVSPRKPSPYPPPTRRRPVRLGRNRRRNRRRRRFRAGRALGVFVVAEGHHLVRRLLQIRENRAVVAERAAIRRLFGGVVVPLERAAAVGGLTRLRKRSFASASASASASRACAQRTITTRTPMRTDATRAGPCGSRRSRTPLPRRRRARREASRREVSPPTSPRARAAGRARHPSSPRVETPRRACAPPSPRRITRVA